MIRTEEMAYRAIDIDTNTLPLVSLFSLFIWFLRLFAVVAHCRLFSFFSCCRLIDLCESDGIEYLRVTARLIVNRCTPLHEKTEQRNNITIYNSNVYIWKPNGMQFGIFTTMRYLIMWMFRAQCLTHWVPAIHLEKCRNLMTQDTSLLEILILIALFKP